MEAPFYHSVPQGLFHRLELVLAYSAERAGPVCRKILESRSGRYSVIRVSHCGIIYPFAYRASVLFHNPLIFIRA